MHTALAIASVTAILKSLLENGLVAGHVSTALGADILVSAQPPDRIATGAEERPQLNVYLYQAQPNTKLSLGLTTASRERPGADLPSPPADAGFLPLDLYYLVTAYGREDLQSELLLGGAIEILRSTPQLSPERITETLAALSDTSGQTVLPPTVVALQQSQLADSIEGLTITPIFHGLDEASRIWSALQTHYRLSAAYKVSLLVRTAGPARDETRVR